MKILIGDLVEISGMDYKSTVCTGVVLSINKDLSYCTVSLASGKYFDSVSSFSISGNMYLYPAVQGTVWLDQISSQQGAISDKLAENCQNWFSISREDKATLGGLFETKFSPASLTSAKNDPEFEEAVLKMAQVSKDCVYSVLGGVFSLDLPEDISGFLNFFVEDSGIHRWDYALAASTDKEKSRKFRSIGQRKSSPNQDLFKYLLLRENRLTQNSLNFETGISKLVDKAVSRAVKNSAHRIVFASGTLSAKWEHKSLSHRGKSIDVTLIRQEFAGA